MANPCKQPIVVTTVGPKATTWCYKGGCNWRKEFIIPETGINLPALQREHDGDFE